MVNQSEIEEGRSSQGDRRSGGDSGEETGGDIGGPGRDLAAAGEEERGVGGAGGD